MEKKKNCFEIVEKNFYFNHLLLSCFLCKITIDEKKKVEDCTPLSPSFSCLSIKIRFRLVCRLQPSDVNCDAIGDTLCGSGL